MGLFNLKFKHKQQIGEGAHVHIFVFESSAGQSQILTFSAGQMSDVRRYFKATDLNN